jgi:hypothetical protein
MKMLIRCTLVLTAVLAASGLPAQQPVPLSAADKATVDSLLQAFDPNSYSFTYQYLDAQGAVHTARVGQARGLANLRQSNTVRRVPPSAVAGTNTTINIFKEFAGTNTVINIFREFAGTNTVINVFREAGLNDRARSLNLLLQPYYAGCPCMAPVLRSNVRVLGQPIQRPVQQAAPATPRR